MNDDRTPYDLGDLEDTALLAALPELSTQVKSLFATGTVDAVVIFFSTVPSREFAKVFPKSEAIEAGKLMSESMRAAIDSAPTLPTVRVFHTRRSGEIDQRDLSLLDYVNGSQHEPS